MLDLEHFASADVLSKGVVEVKIGSRFLLFVDGKISGVRDPRTGMTLCSSFFQDATSVSPNVRKSVISWCVSPFFVSPATLDEEILRDLFPAPSGDFERYPRGYTDVEAALDPPCEKCNTRHDPLSHCPSL